MKLIASCAIQVLVAGGSLFAADEAVDERPLDRLEIHAFVDGVYTYNDNRPVDRANFFPGVGTSAKRDNARHSLRGDSVMKNLAFVAITVVFFVVCGLYVRACEQV